MYKILISSIAGILAGVATGFSGLSAAVFISPMLVSFLNMSSFNAVGIALASDVLASFFSALTYHKNNNTDLKNGRILLIAVVSFSIIGTICSFFFTANKTNETLMSYWLIISSMLLGLKMLVKPGDDNKEFKLPLSKNLISLFAGAYIGFICGFQGTGGGLMMLFVLNILLRFEFKKAVGTSVTIMSITALVGSISHFVAAKSVGDLTIFITCVITTLIGGEAAAILANRMDNKVTKRITGLLMVLSGIITLLVKLF